MQASVIHNKYLLSLAKMAAVWVVTICSSPEVSLPGTYVNQTTSFGENLALEVSLYIPGEGVGIAHPPPPIYSQIFPTNEYILVKLIPVTS